MLIDDDPERRARFRTRLDALAGPAALLPAGSESAETAILRARPDLLLVDVDGHAGSDGVRLIARLRQSYDGPIVLVSPEGRLADKIAALDAGADDLLPRQHDLDELLMRVRVVLRHRDRQTFAVLDELGHFHSGPLRVDGTPRQVLVNGRRVKLSPKEWDFLQLFIRHAGTVLTHQQILAELWSPRHIDDLQYLRVYVGHLRRKLETDPARPVLILSEPGVGYRLAVLPPNH
jgi:two-component system KDP operon response regulator KdpE